MGLPGELGWGLLLSLCSAHIDAWQLDTHPPTVGYLSPPRDPGTGFDDSIPYKEGQQWQKREKGTQPQQCLCLCAPLLPHKDKQISAGLGQRGGAGVEREEAGVGTRPPAGRRAGGL